MLNVMNLGGGTGNASYKVVTIEPSDVISQNDKTFPYYYDVTWEAATETDFVDASIRSGEYDGSYQIESMAGKLRIRFTKEVTDTLLMYVYIMTGEVNTDGTPGDAYYDKTTIDTLEWQGFDGAGFHNSIYRGKYLGDAVSDEYWTAIGNGTFRGLFIGDYWKIGDFNWRIAHFDYWLNTGDVVCTDHHAVIVPDNGLYTAQMNDINTTEGGYGNSKMRTTNLTQAKNIVNVTFGSGHILNHRELLSNLVIDGRASNWGWYDSDVDIMNDIMVSGNLPSIYNLTGSSNFNIGIDKTQFNLFQLRPELITSRQNFWLRSVTGSDGFSFVGADGLIGVTVASSNGSYVRPCFAIKAS